MSEDRHLMGPCDFCAFEGHMHLVDCTIASPGDSEVDRTLELCTACCDMEGIPEEYRN